MSPCLKRAELSKFILASSAIMSSLDVTTSGLISTIEQSNFKNNLYKLLIKLQQELTCFPLSPNPKAIFLACQSPIPVTGSA